MTKAKGSVSADGKRCRTKNGNMRMSAPVCVCVCVCLQNEKETEIRDGKRRRRRPKRRYANVSFCLEGTDDLLTILIAVMSVVIKIDDVICMRQWSWGRG